MNIRHALHFLLIQMAFVGAMVGCATPAPSQAMGSAESPTAATLMARLHDAVAAREGQYAVQSLWTLLQKYPEALAKVPDDDVRGAVAAASTTPPGPGTRVEILEALFKANWKPFYGVEPSDYWLDLTQARLDAHDLTGARASAARITNPHELIIMQSDRRFDEIVDRDPDGIRMKQSAQGQVELLRAAAVRYPRSLLVVYELVHALEIAGEYQEAISLGVQAAAAEADSVKHRRNTYEDDSNWVWLLDEVAYVLWDTGQFENATRVMRTASQLRESGGPNVSQELNLAIMYCQLGKLSVAADLIDEMRDRDGNPSAYGSVVMHGVYLQIAIQKNDLARRTSELNFMRDHQNIGRYEVLRNFLIAADTDDATAWLRNRLADPATRGETLVELQHSLTGERTAIQQQQAAIKQAWLESAPVQAEIEKWGRIGTYPVTDDAL